MIKITKLISKAGRRNLILIPGGPGLSSNTIRHLDLLLSDFNLHYVDFPGTNLIPYRSKKSFEELLFLLSEEVSKIEGECISLGHSYGGLFACSLALKKVVQGVVCLGVPMSPESLEIASANYFKADLPKLKLSADVWNKEKSDQNFVNWLSEYEHLYFSDEKIKEGKELLKNDYACAQFFIDNRSDILNKISIFQSMKDWSGHKLFIAGKEDGLLSLERLRNDAAALGFDFKVVSKASHFMTVDQPMKVYQLINEYFDSHL